MYLIPTAPRVFNIKWDRDHTLYAGGAPLPATAASAVQSGAAAAAVAVPRVPYPPSSSIPFARRMDPTACMGCNCSARGIGKPPQKRMGQLGDSAGVPAGTTLAYTASWPDTKLQLKTPDAVQAQIQATLAQQFGIVIDSQWHSQSDYFNFSGTQSMTLQVHTNSDYGAPADVQSLIDHAVYTATKSMPNSTIRIVQSVAPGAGGSAIQQFPASDPAAIAAAQAGYADAIARGDTVSASQFAAQIANAGGQDPRGVAGWFSSNWKWLAAAAIGLVAVKELV